MITIFYKKILGNIMKINKKEIFGNWNKGYALDKHTIRSAPAGYNQYGYQTYDTLRSELGEAVYQLKYRQNWDMVEPIAQTLADLLTPNTQNIELIIPVPASRNRPRQPVSEIVSRLSEKIKIPYHFGIVTTKDGSINHTAIKNLNSKEAKVEELVGRLQLNQTIEGEGRYNTLVIDDIYDSGASLEATCEILRKYAKIKNIYVLTLTWK